MPRLIHQWKTLSLTESEILLPTKEKILHTSIVHPGAAVILPITEQGEIVLLRQFRPTIDKWLYELPAGTMEVGETPLDCAMRELEEETGYSAQLFSSLGELIPLAGFCDEVQHLFIAKNLNKTARYQLDPDEIIEVQVYSLEQIEQMIIEGSITDSKTIASIFKAKICGSFN